MTAAGHQLPINSSPSSPFCSASYAAFVKDKELLQAKADVEECFRRRARRAGLEGSLRTGRPMTDEEINHLKWQLGDWGPANGYGSKGVKRDREVIDMTIEELGDWGPANGYGSKGVKRNREVIDMTIEEMEAEIRETNELIRKRRRRNLGLMLKPLWMLTCLMVSSVEAFTAYDCSNRSNVVESYSLLEPDACRAGTERWRRRSRARLSRSSRTG
jgi:hypothetical protein